MSLQVDVQVSDELAPALDAMPTAAQFEQWVVVALAEKRSDAELSIRLVDEGESAELNQTFRHQQGSTNVLSFPAEFHPQVETTLLGDLVICGPVVVREAREQGKAVTAHWAHMVVHGVLHLLGYDHQDSTEADTMEAEEIRLLALLGVPNPYDSGALAKLEAE